MDREPKLTQSIILSVSLARIAGMIFSNFIAAPVAIITLPAAVLRAHRQITTLLTRT